MAGVAYSYGNSITTPYSEQFYIGGANSIRAFTIRSIGPGSYRPTDSKYGYLDQTGDIKFEANRNTVSRFWAICTSDFPRCRQRLAATLRQKPPRRTVEMGPFPERPGFRNRYRTTLRPDLPRYPPGLGNRLARTVRYGKERLLQYSGLQRRHGRPSAIGYPF